MTTTSQPCLFWARIDELNDKGILRGNYGDKEILCSDLACQELVATVPNLNEFGVYAWPENHGKSPRSLLPLLLFDLSKVSGGPRIPLSNITIQPSAEFAQMLYQQGSRIHTRVIWKSYGQNSGFVPGSERHWRLIHLLMEYCRMPSDDDLVWPSYSSGCIFRLKEKGEETELTVFPFPQNWMGLVKEASRKVECIEVTSAEWAAVDLKPTLADFVALLGKEAVHTALSEIS